MNRYKRIDDKTHVIATSISEIAPLYHSKVKAPHCLMELSQRDYNRMRNSCIDVSGLTLIKDTSINATNGATMTQYNIVSYGRNVNISKKKIDTGNTHEMFQYINLCKISGHFIAMVADKEECIRMIPNTYTISSCVHTYTGKNKPIKMLGKLVLFMAMLPKVSTKMCSDKVWNKQDFVMVKKCKPNIMDSFHHHGSLGNYYSFGNKANYGMVDTSSVGVYSNKKSKNPIKQQEITKKADAIEVSGIYEIKTSVDLLSKVIPNITYTISPIIDTADELQNPIGNANLKRVETSCRGCWNMFLSINAMTEYLHTENDCGYTVIKVPNRNLIGRIKMFRCQYSSLN